MSRMFDFVFAASRKNPIASFLLKRLYSCDIPRRMQIGKNVCFQHNALGVVIHPGTIIGDNVVIQHHVLLGEKNGSDAPVICDNVVINPYAVIIGKVTIGENAIIGAGSIVTKDVPANCVYYNKVEPVIRPITPEEYEKLTR